MNSQPKGKQSIIYLEQHPVWKDDKDMQGESEYLVKKLINRQRPPVGTWISEEEFDALNADLNTDIEVFANPRTKRRADRESRE